MDADRPDATSVAACLPPGRGAFIAVVGPSGAGKDSILDKVRATRDVSDVRFVRRLITRPAGAGGEDHQPVSAEAFDAAQASGALVLWWRAHDLAYGIPAETRTWVEDGLIVVANLSRSVLADALDRFPRLIAVNVTCDASVLAGRLAARGRESAEDVSRRLKRDVPLGIGEERVYRIENSADLDVAADRFAALIEAVRATQ
ncbi:phosphonate metabolism protein/1,5-bisphosphokinase (PRPP-forming) PhnN [Tepidamorphus sp. 3E244]|uniref:phosphonate metabolism protein/1,5-bisphosphokinase (PRPP-forming) PhnN n=1 Tax=Tepidamorphus sp. 3E244 TaxID=3385498 RepID=UPI0038FC1DE4